MQFLQVAFFHNLCNKVKIFPKRGCGWSSTFLWAQNHLTWQLIHRLVTWLVQTLKLCWYCCIWAVVIKAFKRYLFHYDFILTFHSHFLPSRLYRWQEFIRHFELLTRVLSPPSNHCEITCSPHSIIEAAIVHTSTQDAGVQRCSAFQGFSANYSSSRKTQ